MQIEECAGLGFGVCILLLASIVATTLRSRFALFSWHIKSTEALWQMSVRFAPWISFTALLSQSVVYPIGRIFVPYYALLIPLILTGPSHERLLRQRWWRASAFAVFAIAAVLLIVSPARPLFPDQMIVGKIKTSALEHPLLARVQVVYSVYRERWDAFAPVRAILPADATVLGMVTFDDPETSLWHPFGSLRIEHVCPGDTVSDLRQRGIQYILVRSDLFESQFDCPLNEWLKRMNGEILQTVPLNLRASRGPVDWYVIRLR
jgi:hypothetical protein